MWRNKFLKFRTKRQLKKNKAERRTVKYDDAKTFGVLCKYTNGDDLAMIKSYINHLIKDGKKVKALFYASPKR